MEHTVTGCIDCPMLNSVFDEWGATYHCNYNMLLPEENEFEIKDENITPDWCPLNKEPITIIKK